LVERINPTIAILSHAEIHPHSRLRTIDQI
jgi:hypothetical protein